MIFRNLTCLFGDYLMLTVPVFCVEDNGSILKFTCKRSALLKSLKEREKLGFGDDTHPNYHELKAVLKLLEFKTIGSLKIMNDNWDMVLSTIISNYHKVVLKVEEMDSKRKFDFNDCSVQDWEEPKRKQQGFSLVIKKTKEEILRRTTLIA